MTKSKTKEETPFWADVLALLVVGAVKVIGLALVILIFYWPAKNAFAQLEPQQAFAMSYAVLAAMIVWR